MNADNHCLPTFFNLTAQEPHMFPIRTTLGLIKFTAIAASTAVVAGSATAAAIMGGVGATKALVKWAKGEKKELEKKVDDALHEHAHRDRQAA